MHHLLADPYRVSAGKGPKKGDKDDEKHYGFAYGGDGGARDERPSSSGGSPHILHPSSRRPLLIPARIMAHYRLGSQDRGDGAN